MAFLESREGRFYCRLDSSFNSLLGGDFFFERERLLILVAGNDSLLGFLRVSFGSVLLLFRVSMGDASGCLGLKGVVNTKSLGPDFFS